MLAFTSVKLTYKKTAKRNKKADGDGKGPVLPCSQQNNVVLFLAQAGFGLQGNGFANEVDQARQMLAFFFQE